MRKAYYKKTCSLTIFCLLLILGFGSNIKATEYENPTAIIDTSKGTIKIELYLDKTPDTVTNFINLAQDGFYDGMIFHRIKDNFMIQAGNTYPDGSTKESPYGNIEFEYDETLSHVDGAISMASTGSGVGGSSQFFICDEKQSFLDGSYAIFGVTTEGIEVVRDIADDPRDDSSPAGGGKPYEDILINSITIEGYSTAINEMQEESNTITDQEGDIIYYNGQTGENPLIHEYYQGLKRNIDITEVSIKIENKKIVLSLKVSGEIIEDDYYQYNVFYTSNEATYSFIFSNKTMNANYIVTNVKGGAHESYTINGDTISVIFNASTIGVNNVDLYGYAYQFTDLLDAAVAEHWSDYAPINKEPTLTQGETYLEEGKNYSNGSPGFELVLIILATIFLLYIKNKKK